MHLKVFHINKILDWQQKLEAKKIILLESLPLSKYFTKAYSEPRQTSKKKLFAKIVNDWKSLTYFRKKLLLRCLILFWIHIYFTKNYHVTRFRNVYKAIWRVWEKKVNYHQQKIVITLALHKSLFYSTNYFKHWVKQAIMFNWVHWLSKLMHNAHWVNWQGHFLKSVIP